MNCIIVDDEPGARLILENYVGRLGNIALCGKYANAVDAFNFIKTNKVDLVLLDINLPEVDGFGLLDMLEQKPMVIFTTAYSDFALKGFEYNAVDYLHKPIRFERFVKAIEKAQKWSGIQPIGKSISYLELKIEGASRRLNLSDIYYIESLGNYIRLYTPHNTLMALMPMSEVESRLPANLFVRIHKSYLVNATYIRKTSGDNVWLGDTCLPVGKTYKKYFAEFMKTGNKA